MRVRTWLPTLAILVTLPHGARVLLIRLSALGDVLFGLETLASLKRERPDLRCDFLVEDRFASALLDHPQIERLLLFPRRTKSRLFRSLCELRRVRYEAVLDLQGNLKSALHTLCARGRRKLGYAAPAAREGAAWFYREKVKITDLTMHRAARGYELLKALGLSGAEARPVLPLPATPPDLWNDAPRPRIVLHPGVSAFGAFKRWPAARYAQLLSRLVARGLTVAVSHGPGEAELAREVRGATEPVLSIDGGALGLVGLAAAYRAADVVVAADTGPLHLAAAAGTRVVALYGPKDARLYGPRGEGHQVLSHAVPCRPCTRRTCPSPVCVLGIEVTEVEAAVLETLTSASCRAGS